MGRAHRDATARPASRRCQTHHRPSVVVDDPSTRFRRDGYAFPLRVFTEVEAAAWADDVLSLAATGVPDHRVPWNQKTHLLLPSLDALVGDRRLTDRVADVLGAGEHPVPRAGAGGHGRRGHRRRRRARPRPGRLPPRPHAPRVRAQRDRCTPDRLRRPLRLDRRPAARRPTDLRPPRTGQRPARQLPSGGPAGRAAVISRPTRARARPGPARGHELLHDLSAPARGFRGAGERVAVRLVG